CVIFFFSSRRRHTRSDRDWSSDVCSSDLKAAESLQKRSTESRPAMKQATQQLEKFNQAMTKRSAEQQLADAYRLKHMLDQQIQTFGKCSNPGANVSDADLQSTTGQARETINQLKKLAEQEPTRDAFGQPLR